MQDFRARRTITSALRMGCLMLALTATLMACAETVKHDEGLAAKRALEFARVVFFEKDLDKGYTLLSENAKRHIPLDKFKQTIKAMHPNGYPDRVTAIEYEPMAGEKAIYIYLTGRNADDQSFNYRITMEGTAAADYKVLKIDQGGGFPTLTNQKQPFKPVISIP